MVGTFGRHENPGVSVSRTDPVEYSNLRDLWSAFPAPTVGLTQESLPDLSTHQSRPVRHVSRVRQTPRPGKQVERRMNKKGDGPLRSAHSKSEDSVDGE